MLFWLSKMMDDIWGDPSFHFFAQLGFAAPQLLHEVRSMKEHVDISFNILAYDAATHNGHIVPDVLTMAQKVA